MTRYPNLAKVTFTINDVLVLVAVNWDVCLVLYEHSEKSPARPMLIYSTNYWQQFRMQFVV